MKRFVPTIILVIVCIGAFWYASSQSFFKKAEESTAKPLVTVKKEDITAVKLKTGADNIEMELKDGKWTMSKPQAIPLSSFETDTWASSFVTLTQEGEVDANPTDLSGFGLQTPAQEYEVTLKGGSVKTVQVGAPLPIAGYYYVKLKDAPNVYKVSETAIQGLAKTPMDFMEKMPIAVTYSDVLSVSLTWNGASKSLTKSDPAKTASESAWKFGDKELTGSEATSFLDQILLLSTDQLAKPSSSIKLDSPELKLELKQKKDGKDSTDAYTGKVDGETVWIVKQGDTWAYGVPKASVQDLYDALK